MVAAARKARVIIVGKAGFRFKQVRRSASRSAWMPRRPTTWWPPSARVTERRGADVTIDATGRPEVWEQAMDAVTRGGTVVFFGGCAPGTTVPLDTRRVHYEELTLLGAFHHTPETIRRAVDLLDSGAVNPEGL